jgi:hypothetical protein
MKPTRVYSGKWIFDGTEYHRPGVDEIQNVEAVRFYPRVDIRHHEYDDAIGTYRTDPDRAGFASLTEARNHAETARAEWEAGKRTLYRIPELDDPLSWPNAWDEESRNKQQPEITVGSLVTAKRDLGLRNSDGVGLMDCWAGEAGVCFAVERDERPEYGFLFQRGGCGGFSPDEVKGFLEVGGSVSKSVADYRFTNVGQLQADYSAGRFDTAFEERNIEGAQERSAWPPAREILHRQDRENEKREIAGIESKKWDYDLES